MNPSQVDNAISNASRLMNGGFMNLVEDIAAKRNGKPSRNNGGDLKYLEEQAFGGGRSTNVALPQMQQMQNNGMTQQFSNSALQESFAKMPPISGNNFPGADSVGMTLSGYQPGASLLKEQQQFVQQPQQVYQPQYIPQPQYGTIDYNLIKQFINEAIKENLNEIKKSLITEGSLRGINMPGGNKIQFLDSKGNLYEGQLVMKKKKQ